MALAPSERLAGGPLGTQPRAHPGGGSARTPARTPPRPHPPLTPNGSPGSVPRAECQGSQNRLQAFHRGETLLDQPRTGLLRWIRKRYTVMVLDGPEGGIRHFNLPAAVIPMVLVLLIAGLGGGTAAFLGWTSGAVEESHLIQLESENSRLTARLMDVQETVRSFEVRMEEAADIEREFRNLANLDQIPDDVRRLGVGGPLALSGSRDLNSGEPGLVMARETLHRLADLERRATFRSANFREMVGALRTREDELSSTPSISPVRRGWFSSRYGMREDPFTGRRSMHRGVDLSAWTGTPVYATADGRVSRASRHSTLGLLVEINHGNGIKTRYGHNSKLLVKVGQRVRRGDIIAEVGSTGRSTSPHCHYEIQVNGRHTNPRRYILDGGPRVG